MSTSSAIAKMTEHFAELTDHRVERTKCHALIDIVVIALCWVICSCNSWEDLPKSGRSKRDWLRRYLRLTNWIPSADPFARVFQRLDPDDFIRCLREWLGAVRMAAGAGGEEVVAIDGQTSKGQGFRGVQ